VAEKGNWHIELRPQRRGQHPRERLDLFYKRFARPVLAAG
jgi:hypothetical protein